MTDGSDKWIEAGLAELAEGGIERVRVEVVAERLGVTKGGFYRRFKDRRALLDAVLETWSGGRIAGIEQQTTLGGLTPRERLKSLVKLYTERIQRRRAWPSSSQSANGPAPIRPPPRRGQR